MENMDNVSKKWNDLAKTYAQRLNKMGYKPLELGIRSINLNKPVPMYFNKEDYELCDMTASYPVDIYCNIPKNSSLGKAILAHLTKTELSKAYWLRVDINHFPKVIIFEIMPKGYYSISRAGYIGWFVLNKKDIGYKSLDHKGFSILNNNPKLLNYDDMYKDEY